MMCFRNLFLLTVITICFAKEATPETLVAKEPQPAAAEAAPALVPDTVGAPTKPATEPAKAKKESAALEAPGGGLLSDAETKKDEAALEAPHIPPAAVPIVPALQEIVEEDAVAMTHMWHLAALLSFVGIAAYSFVFLCKVFPSAKSYIPMKSSTSSAAGSICQDDLDFDDVELAVPVETTPSPASRKKCGTLAVSEDVQVLPKEDAHDGGWGDNSWDSQDWDDLDDCEAELDTISSSISSASLPQTPAPVKKRGKSD